MQPVAGAAALTGTVRRRYAGRCLPTDLVGSNDTLELLVPESRKRKKTVYTPPPNAAGARPRKKGPSPRWLPPLMLALFLIGIVWLVVFYISKNGDMFGLPVAEDWGNANLLVGFGFIIAGFGLSTQWR